MTWLARVATLASLANGLVQAAAYFSPLARKRLAAGRPSFA